MREPASTPVRSTRVTLGPERVRGWAQLTCDDNPLHLDSDYAASTPFGVPITHGHLLACVVIDTLQRGVDAQRLEGGRVSVRFRAPVPVGDEFRVESSDVFGELALRGFCGNVEALQIQIELPRASEEDSNEH